MNIDFLYALLGGLMIGLSVTLMLLFKGRVTGISGITYNLLTFSKDGWFWRLAFLCGLFVGGGLLQYFAPTTLENSLNLSDMRLVLAGFFVGFGTVLGNGCTSGHGVCGISRFSLRSIVATCTFIAFGVLTVTILGRGA